MISFSEGYKWFYTFETSKLTCLEHKEYVTLLNVLFQKIIQGKYSEACRVIKYLKSYQSTIDKMYQSNRDTCAVKGKVWLECALAYYVMGYLFEVVKSLKMAIVEFPPVSRERAVILCMLGIVQWDIENDNAEALLSWEEALKIFDSLFSNCVTVKEMNWYKEKISVINCCMKEKVFATFS